MSTGLVEGVCRSARIALAEVRKSRGLAPFAVCAQVERVGTGGGLSALRAGRVASGESVLVTAAASGTGHLAVQLDKALGAARVVAAAGSADKADFARQCGADEVVTYSQPSWGDPVDLVLDGVGGELSSAALTLWPRPAGWSPSASAAAPSAPEACSAN
jgi:NADPH:quinone reductase-like Zn-dependent oxidoreductase